MTSVALLSGLLQIAYGLLGGGKVIKYIPYPVVSGFMSGVAVLIFVKQLPGLLGVASGTRLLTALSAPEGWRVPSIVVGLITVAGVVLAPRITKAVPAAIIGLFSGGAAYAGLAAIDPSLRTLTGNPLVVGSLNASLGGVLSGHWPASAWQIWEAWWSRRSRCPRCSPSTR